jgi:hypothetical protein
MRDALMHFEVFSVKTELQCDFNRYGRLTGALSQAQLADVLRESDERCAG